MAISRKRKHAVAADQQQCQQTSQTPKTDETNGSLSKDISSDNGPKKRKTVHEFERESTPPAITLTKPTPARSDRKRRRGEDADRSEDESATKGEKAVARPFAKYAKKDGDKTTGNKPLHNVLPPSPAETPSKRAAAMFDKLKLDSSIPAIPFQTEKNSLGYETPPGTPEEDKEYPPLSLPVELHDFTQLHAAFLTALSLYYSHNGTTSPVEVNVFLPMITKNWKKRAVTLLDLQRLLAIGERCGQHFFLQDYGRAGIYLSRAEPRGRALKRAASYIDEDDLNGRFEEVVQKCWSRWKVSEDEENRDPCTFLDCFALDEITKHESTAKAAPMFARGQQRLADLKAGQASAKQETVKSSSADVTAEHKTPQAVQSRGTSLLDRVLAKQALTASMPAGPNREQLERKAALHRIEEIARVLDLLAAGKPRASFSMQGMVQQVQQSVRNPISREEVERCIDLMAKEVMPGFVTIIQSGAVKGVVFRQAGRVGLEDLKARLIKAGA